MSTSTSTLSSGGGGGLFKRVMSDDLFNVRTLSWLVEGKIVALHLIVTEGLGEVTHEEVRELKDEVEGFCERVEKLLEDNRVVGNVRLSADRFIGDFVYVIGGSGPREGMKVVVENKPDGGLLMKRTLSYWLLGLGDLLLEVKAKMGKKEEVTLYGLVNTLDELALEVFGEEDRKGVMRDGLKLGVPGLRNEWMLEKVREQVRKERVSITLGKKVCCRCKGWY